MPLRPARLHQQPLLTGVADAASVQVRGCGSLQRSHLARCSQLSCLPPSLALLYKPTLERAFVDTPMLALARLQKPSCPSAVWTARIAPWVLSRHNFPLLLARGRRKILLFSSTFLQHSHLGQGTQHGEAGYSDAAYAQAAAAHAGYGGYGYGLGPSSVSSRYATFFSKGRPPTVVHMGLRSGGMSQTCFLLGRKGFQLFISFQLPRLEAYDCGDHPPLHLAAGPSRIFPSHLRTCTSSVPYTSLQGSHLAQGSLLLYGLPRWMLPYHATLQLASVDNPQKHAVELHGYIEFGAPSPQDCHSCRRLRRDLCGCL